MDCPEATPALPHMFNWKITGIFHQTPTSNRIKKLSEWKGILCPNCYIHIFSAQTVPLFIVKAHSTREEVKWWINPLMPRLCVSPEYTPWENDRFTGHAVESIYYISMMHVSAQNENKYIIKQLMLPCDFCCICGKHECTCIVHNMYGFFMILWWIW